ncbi:hypothetical protein Gotri_005607 [Gossypium trilobum]|uniref:beta-galactosidase n=1 Tax=Gossypium trilobum TaxID=34281 RepID=A0A7J9EY26_9ROSI|nr:hypothetical protein [Gossypium trilobum]
MSKNLIQFLLLVSLALSSSCSAVKVEYDANAIIIDGQRKIMNVASIHYPRSTEQMWPDLIMKAKDGGIGAIETYIFWDVHEARHRQGTWNFIKFFQLVHEAGLYGIIRIGPYHSRRNHLEIQKEMETFTTKIVNKVKVDKLFAPQGGPIIVAQIENEYGNIMKGYGAAGKKYIEWCAKMAVAQNISVPPMINTCNGFYCDNFKPNNLKKSENVDRELDRMYHGGTKPGCTSDGLYITASYDYDAPLDEFGNQFAKQANGLQLVNGDDYSFEFEKPVSLEPGANTISLLSATIGLPNYGFKYDMKPTGLVGGAVLLINPAKNMIGLTPNTWSYGVGLDGELSQRLFDPKSPNGNVFKAGQVPTGRPMFWYKAAMGTEPVVVDLLGMGKGHAWVNGKSIGRYWPAQIADSKYCSNICDYRSHYKK